MIEIVVNYDKETNNFRIYESTTKTLLISDTLGDGFRNLSEFLRQSGSIATNIVEEPGILYHIDSYTFSEIIKSNQNLLTRVKEVSSEFKNSAQKFGTTLGNNGTNRKPEFSRGSTNFKKGKMSGFKKSGFGKSFGKFGNYGNYGTN